MDSSEYITSRRIGEATITLINDGMLRWNPQLIAPEDEVRRAIPEAEADGTISLGLFVAHIKLGAASILIDTGHDDPSPEFAHQHPEFTTSPGVQAGLASIGVSPEEITHVLFTHPHGDHILAATVECDGERVPRYPNARYLIGRRDWEGSPAREHPDSPQSIHFGTLDRLGLLDLTEGEYEVAPGIVMSAAPGESPGHSIVRVDSAGARSYFLGDLFHHPCEVAHLDWVSPGRNREMMQESRKKLIADALATNATLAFSHGQFPPWGRIVRADGGQRWEYA
jgi:glyoxylase-like metal-dependent hydrolase (beta-lactamase superfamily II)